MRSIFCEIDGKSSELLIEKSDPNYHHLSRVIKIRKSEEILLLDGVGNKYLSAVEEISSKDILLKILRKEYVERSFTIDVALGNPKKEYFEDIVRVCCECGIRTLFPLETKYSQFNYMPSDRIDRICESALTQSNNPYRLQIDQSVNNFQVLMHHLKSYDVVIAFTSQVSINQMKNIQLNSSHKILLIIGPEGGYSEEEHCFFNEHKIIQTQLETPIMKSITAVPVAIGFVMGRFG